YQIPGYADPGYQAPGYAGHGYQTPGYQAGRFPVPGQWEPTDRWPPPGDDWNGVQPAPTSGRGPVALFVVGLLVVALMAVSGVVLVRAFWPAIDGTAGGTGRVSGTGRSGVGSGPGTGGAPDLGGGPGTQATPGPGTPADAAGIAAAVAPTIVDVNTTLGLEGAQAAGTGIVLTGTGVVLTNNHVIAGATGISVTDVGNGRAYTATVVGYDRTDDVAVIQLQNASGLRTASLGDASTVNAGDAIVAVGNAGGVGGAPTAVAGTVSAVNQAITASDESGGHAERLSGLIQVAADIQPGDSGGPLVDAGGKIIGVNTAASAGFRFQASGGQGYAIPINRATAIADEIRAGHASTTVHIGGTAFLGVDVASGDTTGGGGGGAPVAAVVAGSPAEQAGLTRGDTIVSVDGTAVDTGSAVIAVLDAHHPGDRVALGWTDTSGRPHRATVRLATGPAA
ncbi:MAG: hypothetical protein QOI74_2502, partial [Micromonosporaceae bacterium]|nr:hypothetical protein [Micromonosporaceae bacterium]